MVRKPKIELPHYRPPAARALIGPVKRFIALEAAGAFLLVACTIAALIWANSPYSESYFHLWEIPFTVGLGEWAISKDLHHWINDGLMAVFFFLVGLEIKREVLVGELSTGRKAALPLVAAVGGMVVPAALYALLNVGTPEIVGWGVPMATDIAFALGVITLLRDRVPGPLKVFLVALAIADDLGAVLVIALFYTPAVSVPALLSALVFLLMLVLANAMGVRRPVVFLVLGIALWVAVLNSGVHATIAGVLAAMTIPAKRRIDTRQFSNHAHAMIADFDSDLGEAPPGMIAPTASQRESMYALEEAIEAVDTPLSRIEEWLHGWVAFGIIPVFALANAGVEVSAGFVDALFEPLGLGIIAGLFIGKQIGVTLFSWLAVKLGLAELPSGVRWSQLYGVATLCGIGFTMSLFIANLAFSAESLEAAKGAILLASLASVIWGWIVLVRVHREG